MSTPLSVMESQEIERVLLTGDLSKLTPDQRISYYNRVCESLDLNPLTKPFLYLTLNGKTVLYASKDCTEQMRHKRVVSVRIVAREVVEGCYVVTAQAALPSGRVDESIGAVPIENLRGEARSNAMMKCETKAKRRVTLSICGLGMLDESEVDSIPGAVPFEQGSKQAQQDVAQRKIKELTTQLPPSGPAHAIDMIVESTPPEVIIELANSLDTPEPTYEQREAAKRAKAEQALNVAKPPTEPRRKGNISFKALKEIGTLKTVIRGITGSDDRYYEVLKAAGVDHADELSLTEGRKVYKALLAIPNAVKQDEALLLEVQTHAWRIGPYATQAALERRGLKSIEEVLHMPNGEDLDALLRELRATA